MKLDSSFPLNQFHIDGFRTPYRLDRNQNCGSIMLYIREDIPSKSLTEIKLDNEIENIFIEINLRSKKIASFWFLQPKIEPHQKSFTRNWKRIRLLFIKI